ncbi:hypothetical protein FH972_024245 [Carpinus fangiana]|uniref:Methyltransferase type 11 domain-containing protein n=1 Tax=Carpinus fangiana TaxID=176857 RepID=A0A5N6KY75_9ROSI|nr:hypothetical protein FH972_024245 [Carpinus fangiana]
MLDGLGLLPSVAYQRPQAGRSDNTNNTPSQLQLQPNTYQSNVDEDNFPTPRGLPSSQSDWRDSRSSFNSLYDLSDDDDDDNSEVVPLRLSNSVKRAVQGPSGTHKRLPSLVIPSPTAWPTIQKLKARAAPASTLAPLPLSPQALATLSIQNSLQVPAVNATPSLDGSLTSDEVASMSSCTTPSMSHAGNDDTWDMPIQLDAHAMDTLLALDVDEAESVVEVTDAQAGEMQSQGRSMFDVVRGCQPDNPGDMSACTAPSPISLPSPGGFFSGLDSPSKRVWSSSTPQQAEVPNTSTAENFYNVPWSDDITERFIDAATAGGTDGPPTARKYSRDSEYTLVDELVIPVNRQYEYDEQYEKKLHQEATTNMSRTSLWLNAQDTYMSGLATSNVLSESPVLSCAESVVSPRKNVRFALSSETSGNAVRQVSSSSTLSSTSAPDSEQKQKANSLFYHAFQHLLATNSVESAYTHRHVRASALSTQRRYMADKHRRQLSCSYTLAPSTTVASSRDFSHLPDAPTSALDEQRRAALQTANRERQALDQLSLSVWTLLATRFLAAGSSSLLPPPAAAVLASKPTARVLDLGGQPTADWAWAMSLEYRSASIHTVVLDNPSTDWKLHRGPRNHRVTASPCPWTLAFADGSFDIVSARTLHTLLRDNHGFDEWQATLAEIRRVLAPGGIFCYEAMDAEVAPPALANAGRPMGAALAARSAEFAVSVRQLGYSASAGQAMQSRLQRAGWSAGELTDGKRAWVGLPLATTGLKSSTDSVVSVGSSASTVLDSGVEAVTSLAGSVTWERWMLKLQREMGRPEERLLDGVGKALDEANGHGEWRVLRGWVRKSL